MTVPSDLLTRWESAYRRYTDVARAIERSPSGRPGLAEAMGSASWEVATAWRDIATTVALQWWMIAALRAAADAFEQQARHWHARGTLEEGESTNP